MIKDLLFEIQCAEEIGYYKMADHLDKKLLKVASKDYKEVRRNLLKKLQKINTASNLSFSPSRGSFIINTDAAITNKDKRTIKDLASPFPVKFKYASKLKKNQLVNLLVHELEDDLDDEGTKEYSFENFDLSDLLDRPSKSGEDLTLERFTHDKDEPTEEDLLFTEEFPAEEIDEEDEIPLLLLARQQLEEMGYLPKKTKTDD